MAVYPENVKRIVKKAIIRSTIGQRSFSPLPLFVQGAEYIIQFIRGPVRIESIEVETQQKKEVVQEAFSELVNPEKN